MNVDEEEKSAQCISDGEDLGHPCIQRTTVLCDNVTCTILFCIPVCLCYAFSYATMT